MTGFAVQEASPGAIGLINADAEFGMLIELIYDNRLIDSAADRCREIDFGDPLYGRVFAAMVDQHATGRAVDSTTLAPFFREDTDWTTRKLFSALSAASLNARGGDRAASYADQIAMLARRRRLVAGMRGVVTAAQDLAVTTEALIVDADDAVAELADSGAGGEQAPAGAYADTVIASFGKPVVGVRCGIIGCLDDLMGPLRPGSYNVIGARPGMAKTATATSYSIGAAGRGHAVLFISLEMTADELTRRILADMTHEPGGGVPYEAIRDGTVNAGQMPRVRAAKQRLDSLPLEIAEPSRLNIAQLRRRVRRHKRRLAAVGRLLELVVVDYLTLMAPSRAGMSPYEHATETSRALKELAKAEALAVIAIAQLSREPEKRTDKRPIPSDLRDSGQIEQDADVILFLYREAYYLGQEEPADPYSQDWEKWKTDMDAVRDRIEFIMPKRRNGPTGKAAGLFFGAHQAVRGADFYKLERG